MADAAAAADGSGAASGQGRPRRRLFSRTRDRVKRSEKRAGKFLRRNAMWIYSGLFFLVILMIVLAPNIFITVPAGHVAVKWYRFLGGTVTEQVYGEGMHMIFPWDEMYIYDARLQNTARTYDTISSNGLSMQVEIAVRYRINARTAGLLHKLVGPNYPEILVYPEIGSHARELISRYTPEQLYTETRAFIQAEILQRMVTQLGSSLANQSFGGRLVTVEDVLLRSVRLPPKVAAAIERKAEQYQMMLEYDFRIAREEKERERKRIEAEGVRDFQDIVARTITQEYLRLRGIEATLALSTSPNTKTVIVGGQDGLPLILNAEGPPAAAPATPAAAGAAGQGPGGQEDPTQRLIRDPPNAAQAEVPAANALGNSMTPPGPADPAPPALVSPGEAGGLPSAGGPPPPAPGSAPAAPQAPGAGVPATTAPTAAPGGAATAASGGVPNETTDTPALPDRVSGQNEPLLSLPFGLGGASGPRQ